MGWRGLVGVGPGTFYRRGTKARKLRRPLTISSNMDYNFLVNSRPSEVKKREPQTVDPECRKALKRRRISNLVVKVEAQLTHSIALSKKMTTTY